MPYTIPSRVISPGSVYQPRQIPAVIRQNARALYYTRGGSISGSLLLDQSALNSGTRRAGEAGRCVNLNGTNQVVRVTDNTALDITDNLTVCAWAKNNNATLAASDIIIGKYDFGNNRREWTIYLNADEKLSLGFGNPADGTVKAVWESTSSITIDNYNHCAFTFESGSLTVYLNGIEIAGSFTTGSAPSTLYNGTSDLIIGAYLSNDTPNNYWDGQLFDVRIYAGDSSVLAAEQIAAIYADGPNNIQFAGQTLAAHYKLDEQSGATCYDSSGNGNNGTIENAVSNWGVTQDIWSFQNQVGYNTSGSVYIPRDESDPTNDVLGNPLTNTGRRPNDAALHSSNCLTADGTLYIAAAHLAGTETVVSSGGTSTPSISASRINFTAGTCWDLLLSDGTHYKLAEGYGTEILDASGNGNHGFLTSAVLANAWGATQNVYHSNLIDGSGKRMWFDKVNDYVNFGSVGNLGVNCRVQFDFSTRSSAQILFSQRDANRSCVLYQLAGSNSIAFYNNNGNVAIWTGTPNGINIRDGNKHTLLFEKNGNDLSITIDGYTMSATKAFADSGNTGDFAVGGHPNELSEFEGLISNVKVDAGNTGTWDLESNGYGNTDSDWIDITGNGNDGTVVGSPEAFYIPAATNGLDVFGNELTEKPSNLYRNRAETLIDFDPDSTPEMGATQLGITVPASHAFGDAFAASTQIFSRQRALTEDRFVVMPEAQTGSALATIQKYTQP